MRKPILVVSVACALMLTATCFQDVLQVLAEGLTDAVGGSGNVVDYPGGDRTAPAVELRYYGNYGREGTLGEGAEPMSVEVEGEELFFVIAVAEDPEGVKAVRIHLSSRYLCHGEDEVLGGISSTAGGHGLVEDLDDAEAGGPVLTKRWLVHTVQLGSACSLPLEPTSTSLGMWAEAENFWEGIATSPELSFTRSW